MATLVATLWPRSPPMPQMFDWIFFAIMLPVPAYLVWDWMKHS